MPGKTDRLGAAVWPCLSLGVCARVATRQKHMPRMQGDATTGQVELGQVNGPRSLFRPANTFPMRRSLLFVIGLALCAAALPPGFEEELYCPSHTCLKKKERPAGWTGPRAMFHECCDEEKGWTTPPHAWGEKVELEVKETLIKKGWHQGRCAHMEGVCGTRQQKVVIHKLMGLMRRMDSMLGM
jgi:hypothetical protein